MKNSPTLTFSGILRKLEVLLMIACGTLPIPVILFAYLAPDLIWWSFLIPALYFVLAAVGLVVPRKFLKFYALLGAALFAVLGWGFYMRSSSIPTIGAVLVFLVIFLLSLKISLWNNRHEMPIGFYATFIVIHIVAQAIQMIDQVSAGSLLGKTTIVITASFFVCALFTLLAWNRNSLNGAAFQSQRASASMRRKNVFLVLLLFLVVVLIAMIPGLVKIVNEFFSWLGHGIMNVFAFLFQKISDSSGNDGSGTNDFPMGAPGQNGEMSPLFLFLRKILFIVVKITVPILVLVLLYFFIRKLVRIFSRMIQKVTAAPTDEYDDEVTDTRAFHDGTKKARSRRKKLLVERRDMTPVERIRLRYLQLVCKHEEDWTEGQTARETLPEDAVELYERARYSEHPVNAEDADQFKSRTSKV